MNDYDEWKKNRDIRFDMWMYQFNHMRQEAVKQEKWELIIKLTEILNGLQYGNL